jgi:hypothetical protein
LRSSKAVANNFDESSDFPKLGLQARLSLVNPERGGHMKMDLTVLLVGLTVELLGALALSVEAIGLERVQHWRSILMAFRGEMKDDYRLIGRRSWPGTLIHSIVSAAGIGAAILLWIQVTHRVPSFDSWFLYVAAAFGGLLSTELVRLVILLIAQFCKFMNEKVRSGSGGVVGFCVLASGIILQMVGTLMQAVIATP